MYSTLSRITNDNGSPWDSTWRWHLWHSFRVPRSIESPSFYSQKIKRKVRKLRDVRSCQPLIACIATVSRWIMKITRDSPFFFFLVLCLYIVTNWISKIFVSLLSGNQLFLLKLLHKVLALNREYEFASFTFKQILKQSVHTSMVLFSLIYSVKILNRNEKSISRTSNYAWIVNSTLRAFLFSYFLNSKKSFQFYYQYFSRQRAILSHNRKILFLSLRISKQKLHSEYIQHRIFVTWYTQIQ